MTTMREAGRHMEGSYIHTHEEWTELTTIRKKEGIYIYMEDRQKLTTIRKK